LGRSGNRICNRLFTFSLAVAFGITGLFPAEARRSNEEQDAIAYFNAHRYSEAAALFRNIVESSGCWARDYYYLALCLTQLKQPALATEYIWKAYMRNADSTEPDPQITNQCVQALANAAYCKTLKLKGNTPQSFRFFDRNGKSLVQGQLAYGPKGLSGEMDSTIDVKFGRFVLPGLIDQQAGGGFIGDQSGYRYVYNGGGVNIKVNRKEFAKEMTDEEYAKYDPEEATRKAKLAPKMFVAFNKALNKDGSADVFLVVYPNR
jgi:tetratricopeptide (TPR) repeat protein